MKVGKETAGRRGKGVTTVFEIPLDDNGVRELAALLKQRCGTGGTVKDRRIEIQGDQRDRIVVQLEKLGYKVKKVAERGSLMLPLYADPHFTFRFADDRTISRFHLEGINVGRRLSVFKIDPDSGERLGLLATASVGEGGWVGLQEPIIVRAGDAFIAVPELDSAVPQTGRIS